MEHQNNIEVFETTEELTIAAAQFIVTAAHAAVSARGRFVISLSGGHTPEQLYTLLSKAPYKDEMPWRETFMFWGDERCVGLDDKDNNTHMTRVTLLNHINVPSGNIYPVPVNLPPAEAALAYEQSITDLFKNEQPCFDVMLLGLGENGHTASLFPGTSVVHGTTRLVKEVYVEEVKMYRITMTTTLINQSRNIMFLVAGEGKAEVLNTVLNTPQQPDKYPAQLIQPVDGKLYWYVDAAAGKLL